MRVKMKPRLLIATLIALVLLPAVSEGQASRRRGASGPAVRDIAIEGNSYFSDKRIKSVMRTEESKFLRTRRLRESTLEADLLSIQALYTRSGFLQASAVIDTLAYDSDRENVRIGILVTEGSQTKIGEVLIEGNLAIQSAKLLRVVKLKAGQPLDMQKVDEETYRLYSSYADQGYVFASVSADVRGTDGRATVVFTVVEGGKAAIGDVTVQGNNRVRSRIVTREITLDRGDIFSGRKLVDSQQKILDTGLFKDVEIEPRPGDPDSATVDLRIRVKERKMREVSLAVGYGTRDEARLTTGWMHRNLWNSGRQFEVRSVLASMDFAKGLTRKRGDLALTDRWLLGMRLVGALAFYGEETLEEYNVVPDGEYTLDRLGLSFSVKKDLPRKAQLTIGYAHEFVNIRNASWTDEQGEDLRLQVGREVNRAATVTLEQDTRKPFFEPVQGSITRISGRRAGGFFGGDNSYNKATWSWSRYLRLYWGSVIALSTRAGYANAFGASRHDGVPEYERFYIGGSSTIRGYDERDFGPGDFMLLANVELRYRLFWKVAGVCFCDMGNVWESIRDFSSSDFDLFVPAEEYRLRRDDDVKYSVGVGLGLQTPVGPARIDYGFRIKRGVDAEGNRESPGRLHLTVGNAF
jgi:outer membrane protein insertion porin family